MSPKFKMEIYCWAKSFCNRRKGKIWEEGYWYFFNKSYNAIGEVYGEQSKKAW